jgi:glycerol-3-phosphate acyltransferase PlsX
MDEQPAKAIREKRDASVVVAARMVADGEALGMVSAGSTGAALAAAALVIGRLPGVSRPAIAAIFPIGHPAVVLDVGANLEVSPKHLAEFGVMGSVLAEIHLGVDEPVVGLLNIGEEAGKGREVEREAHRHLAAMPINFLGNVEGRDLGRGPADVFVTDGFTGNVLLKSSEGTARTVARLVIETLADDDDPRFQEAVGTVLPRLLGLRSRLDPEAYGGAHLVGTTGTVVIAHGSSSRLAIANALRVAAAGAAAGLAGRIEAGLHG